MNINAKKLDIIAKLMEVEDETILAKVKDVLKMKSDQGAFSMGEEEENHLAKVLRESEEDYKAGRVHSQKEVEAFFNAKK